MLRSLTVFLTENPVEASAPCRIDAGGTWDIKALALPFEGIGPTTINIALNLRTRVTLSPYKSNWIKVSSEGFRRSEAFHRDHVRLDSRFGLFFAAVTYFGFHGMAIHIHARAPVRSALGGSSTAIVALIKALAKIRLMQGGKNLSGRSILHLAYHLEDGVSGGHCGIQDQAAALYGGVNQWTWHYGNRRALFDRHPLLDRKGQKEFSKRILVAFSGERHVSSRTNRKWIKDFLAGRTRSGWVEANEIVRRLGSAIKNRNWLRAAGFLREEMALRKRLTPEALTPVTAVLIRQAEGSGCGARFAGAGAGGCVWALGEQEDIHRLRNKWKNTLASIRNAGILGCEVDPAGAR
ncbi:MAG: galactokinase [Deltaproteobacteria bacterium]|nr:MAG: galactokinase [Deltaproteobacteria bacterium]